MFTVAQLRTFLSVLINLDPYTFEDVAEHYIGDDENLASILASLSDDKLTGFALRLILTQHAAIPRESEVDFLAEEEAAFVRPPPKKSSKPKQTKAPTTEEARKPANTPSPKKLKKRPNNASYLGSLFRQAPFFC